MRQGQKLRRGFEVHSEVPVAVISRQRAPGLACGVPEIWGLAAASARSPVVSDFPIQGCAVHPRRQRLEFGDLIRQFRSLQRLCAQAGRVRLDELLQQDPRREAVGDGVGIGKEKDEFVAAERHENELMQRPLPEIPRLVQELGAQLQEVGFANVGGRVAQVVEADVRCRGIHQRVALIVRQRPGIGRQAEEAAQAEVASNQVGDGPGGSVAIEGSLDADAAPEGDRDEGLADEKEEDGVEDGQPDRGGTVQRVIAAPRSRAAHNHGCAAGVPGGSVAEPPPPKNASRSPTVCRPSILRLISCPGFAASRRLYASSGSIDRTLLQSAKILTESNPSSASRSCAAFSPPLSIPE